MIRTLFAAAAVFATADQAVAAPAPAPARAAYGAPVSLADAKALATAAEAAAKAIEVGMVIAVVEPTGDLVLLHKIDGAQYGSTEVALEKARTAARFRRPTKEFEDAVAGGRNAILSLTGVIPVEGGLPIVREGRLIGAIGVSGGTSAQDGHVAQAGLSALR